MRTELFVPIALTGVIFILALILLFQCSYMGGN